MRESHAGGAAKVEGFIGGRVMTHPRQGVGLHTVYNFVPGCQPEIAPGPLSAIARCRDIIVNCENDE